MSVPISDFAVHLRAQDNVAVARKPIPANTTFRFDSGTFTLPKGIGDVPPVAPAPKAANPSPAAKDD